MKKMIILIIDRSDFPIATSMATVTGLSEHQREGRTASIKLVKATTNDETGDA